MPTAQIDPYTMNAVCFNALMSASGSSYWDSLSIAVVLEALEVNYPDVAALASVYHGHSTADRESNPNHISLSHCR